MSRSPPRAPHTAASDIVRFRRDINHPDVAAHRRPVQNSDRPCTRRRTRGQGRGCDVRPQLGEIGPASADARRARAWRGGRPARARGPHKERQRRRGRAEYLAPRWPEPLLQRHLASEQAWSRCGLSCGLGLRDRRVAEDAPRPSHALRQQGRDSSEDREGAGGMVSAATDLDSVAGLRGGGGRTSRRRSWEHRGLHAILHGAAVRRS
mmetsp:Transcript_44308/g.128117  ORF Transcript_44308/g.128117 Transcript_44308/m.128117 type:complete len:208 (+) Transcript_44308:539-1162(+)